MAVADAHSHDTSTGELVFDRTSCSQEEDVFEVWQCIMIMTELGPDTNHDLSACYVKRSEGKGRGVYGKNIQVYYTSWLSERWNSVSKHTSADGHQHQFYPVLFQGRIRSSWQIHGTGPLYVQMQRRAHGTRSWSRYDSCPGSFSILAQHAANVKDPSSITLIPRMSHTPSTPSQTPFGTQLRVR